ncbi:MAG: ribonuclease HII [Gammaproteobacteria bacterium]|nr:ribonuclease HII [Gammaproteobacteria bacterium]
MTREPAFSPASEPYTLVAGTDEVGRGPLAWDVVAAAVILDPAKPISGLADSKKLSHKQRLLCFDAIVKNAHCYAIGRASVQEIESINILQASMLAMNRAVAGLKVRPEFVYVDGNRCPKWDYPSEAVVKGDSLVPSISAASIIAKVTRDKEMQEMELQYPGYGFASNMGYPTPVHLAALKTLGITPIHRRTFAPVARILEAAPGG